MKSYDEIYGMKRLSLDEELALSVNERHTRNNKITIIDQLGHMRNMIDQIEHRAQGAPVLDDPTHAEIVEQFRKLVTRANIALESAAMYGTH